MRLDPYISVDGQAFSATREDIVGARGLPASEERNEVGLTALDYGDVVFRFQDCGRLEEVTVRAPVVHFGTVSVPFSCLKAFIREHDPDAFERASFLISPRFGLAFVPGEPDWVTALAQHCIEQWALLRPHWPAAH
ncbi:MAG: hypothetical protein KGL57_06670 [Burkholderiales bacterium]|nr:hypothetical protein [Burkholderiales bacterium]